ncbi:hypothetical protein H1R20_g14572, partial [Candolleomyces eurysporus]
MTTHNRENEAPGSARVALGKRSRSDDNERPFVLGPTKKFARTDPLVHYGRHIGRTIRMFCRFEALLASGVNLETAIKAGRLTLDDLGEEDRKEYEIFHELLRLVPDLEERVWNKDANSNDILYIATMLAKGVSGARSDDTKSLKSAIIDLITPKGSVLTPALSRNVKTDRGFFHVTTGKYLCPTELDWNNEETRNALRSGKIVTTGDQWPIFLYDALRYNPENPWEGFMKSNVMVSAYKHIFTSPSSVDGEPRATRSGNAAIHGMKRVTPGSLAYVATLVRFSLTSSPTFSRTDRVTDNERFYNLVLEALEDPEEATEVDALLEWWDRKIFPNMMQIASGSIPKNSAFAQMKERRQRLILGESANGVAA